MQQVWAVLIIAQLLQALRLTIAAGAGVDPFEVSMPLLVQYLPQYAARGINPENYISDGNNRKPFWGEFQPRFGFAYDVRGDRVQGFRAYPKTGLLSELAHDRVVGVLALGYVYVWRKGALDWQ